MCGRWGKDGGCQDRRSGFWGLPSGIQGLPHIWFPGLEPAGWACTWKRARLHLPWISPEAPLFSSQPWASLGHQALRD